MQLKLSPYFLLLGIAFGITIILYFLFLKSPYFEPLYVWAQSYKWGLVFILILIKILGILWPPLPGGVATVGSIPLIGGVLAYLADFTGTLLGSSIAYYLGRRYGKAFLLKFIGENAAAQAEKLKIREGREIEAILAMRTLGAGLLIEAVSFGSGLLKVPFWKFIVATITAHLLLGIPAFYLYTQAYDFKNIPYVVLIYAVAIPILWKFRGRYFE